MRTVYLADRDESYRGELARLLRERELEVAEFTSGSELYERVLDDEPDLIVMETDLAGVDGFQAFVWLRRARPERPYPVVFVSKLDHPGVARVCRHQGALDYVVKNRPPEDVAQRVERVLAERRPLHERELPAALDWLQAEGKSGRLDVSAFGESGHVLLERGRILEARWSAFEGDEALRVLVEVPLGARFRFNDWSNEMEPAGAMPPERFATPTAPPTDGDEPTDGQEPHPLILTAAESLDLVAAEASAPTEDSPAQVAREASALTDEGSLGLVALETSPEEESGPRDLPTIEATDSVETVSPGEPDVSGIGEQPVNAVAAMAENGAPSSTQAENGAPSSTQAGNGAFSTRGADDLALVEVGASPATWAEDSAAPAASLEQPALAAAGSDTRRASRPHRLRRRALWTLLIAVPLTAAVAMAVFSPWDLLSGRGPFSKAGGTRSVEPQAKAEPTSDRMPGSGPAGAREPAPATQPPTAPALAPTVGGVEGRDPSGDDAAPVPGAPSTPAFEPSLPSESAGQPPAEAERDAPPSRLANDRKRERFAKLVQSSLLFEPGASTVAAGSDAGDRVLLDLTLGRNGEAREVRIVLSSGNEAIDRAAVAAAGKVLWEASPEEIGPKGPRIRLTVAVEKQPGRDGATGEPGGDPGAAGRRADPEPEVSGAAVTEPARGAASVQPAPVPPAATPLDGDPPAGGAGVEPELGAARTPAGAAAAGLRRRTPGQGERTLARAVDFGDRTARVRGVSPPSPKTPLRVRYPRALADNRMGGAVILKVLVDETGRVADVGLIRSSGHVELDREAVEAVRAAPYHPALDREGRPVPAWIQQRVVGICCRTPASTR